MYIKKEILESNFRVLNKTVARVVRKVKAGCGHRKAPP